MNDKVYIKFNNPKGRRPPTSGRFKKTIKNTIIKIFSTITPKANPDFEHLFDKVEYWKIEFNKKENATRREIGFDKDRNSIDAMPFKNNYGYWIDNHLTLQDYEQFNSVSITQDEFEDDWYKFERKYENK